MAYVPPTRKTKAQLLEDIAEMERSYQLALKRERLKNASLRDDIVHITADRDRLEEDIADLNHQLANKPRQSFWGWLFGEPL